MAFKYLSFLQGQNARQAKHPNVQRIQRKFGKRIKGLRQQKGLTPRQLSNDCGIPSAKLLRIEGGEVNVTLSTIVHFANGFGMKVRDLFKNVA